MNSTQIAAITIFIATLSINEHWINLPGLGVFQKATLLVFGLVFSALFGLRKSLLGPMIGFFVVTGGCLLMAQLLNGSTNLALYVISATSMSIGPLLFAINFPLRSQEAIAKSIAYLPLASLIISLPLSIIATKPLWINEYTGAIRLGGLLPPPHLAMLCVVGIILQSFWLLQSRGSKSLLIANLIILMATGTRGAIITALICLIPHIKIPRSRKNIIILSGLTILCIPPIYISIKNIITRTISIQNDDPINTSGRSAAWDFFVQEAADTPIFGKGLGSVTELTSDETLNNLSFFIVPHNEYIRFYYDIGIIGAFAIFFGMYLLYRNTLKKCPKEYRMIVRFTFLGLAFYSLFDNTFSTHQFIVLFFLTIKYIISTGENFRTKSSTQEWAKLA